MEFYARRRSRSMALVIQRASFNEDWLQRSGYRKLGGGWSAAKSARIEAAEVARRSSTEVGSGRRQMWV